MTNFYMKMKLGDGTSIPASKLQYGTDVSKILQEELTDSVVFLTGVGKCHPIIASHNILNNLHQVLDTVPVVLFYPGEYSGQDLKLFGTMDSRNYYRAFRLV